jgi:dephospho-CoA kinase
MMMIVGITGGIGSGKSVVSQVFESLGVAVYNSDIRSKALLNSNLQLKSRLIDAFGEKIYTTNGIDKTYFARLIFNNKKLLERSNQIIHPFVKQDFEAWVNSQSSDYVIKESAILFETGIYKQLDKTILVTAPQKLRIERVIQRDQIPVEVISDRIKNQWQDAQKEALADFVIVNDETKLVLPQVLLIHGDLLKQAALNF